MRSNVPRGRVWHWSAIPLVIPLLLTVLAASPTATYASSGWTKVGVAALGGHLMDVTCWDASDCWAVGRENQSTLIEHYDGNSWTVVTSPNAGNIDGLNGVACVSAQDCWAVGQTVVPNTIGTDLIEHYDGTSWLIVTGPGLGLFGVACVAANNCWAGGYWGATIEHYDGTAWRIASSPILATSSGYALFRLRCTIVNDCWAVGANNFNTAQSQSLMEHYDGASWSIVSAPHATSNDAFYDIGCTGSSNCWAVGCAAAPASKTLCAGNTLVEHYAGASWAIVPSPSPRNAGELSGIACATSVNCWAVGGPAFAVENLVEHYDGAAWSVDPSPVAAYSVTCSKSGECWAVGFEISRYTPAHAPPTSTPSALPRTIVTEVPATGGGAREAVVVWASLLIAFGIGLIALGHRRRPARR